MLKLLDIDPSFFQDEPVIRPLQVGSGSIGLTKIAADDRITEYSKSIVPDKDKIYVHILAMGAGEYYGANRNADYFPEENLKNFYQTFETSPAHIFQHHINKDPSIAIGKVVFAVYNERMHRVEVIAWIDRSKGAAIVNKIEKGEFPATSMACHTPFDTCAICHNKARSRSQYCQHLTKELGRILPDGRKVMAINDGPLKFFDMSIVFKPADITSSVLQKVATQISGQPDTDRPPEEIAVSSAAAAEEADLQEKKATLLKLSDLIKEVEGTITGSDTSIEALLKKVNDPGDEVLDLLVQFDLHHVLHALAELGISPSIGFFAKLIGQRIAGEGVQGIEHLIQGMIQSEPESVQVPSPQASLTKSASQGSDYGAKSSLISVLTPFVKQSSLFPGMVMARATDPQSELFPVLPGVLPTGNRGYIGGNQGDPRVAYQALRDTHASQQPGLLKTLFMVGGAAIAAKWLLSKLIEQKILEHEAKKNNATTPPVKIVLVKTAQEAHATNQLVRASLLRGLKGL